MGNNGLYYEHRETPRETEQDIYEFVPESHLIGLHTQFINDLEQFNQEYNVNLEVKKTFHWKNGMYNKIRAKTVECVLPWLNNKPRGSHSITQIQQHRYNNFRNDLLRIERKMSDKRWHRYVMGDETDDGFPKWNSWLQAFERGITNFNKCDQLEIPSISNKHFGRVYRHNYRENDGSWYDYNDNKPFIKFVFHIPSINIHYFHGQLLIAKVPWGDVEVHMEMDLYWWANTLGNMAARDRMTGRWSNMGVFTPYVIQHPIYKGLQHPYIKTDMNNYAGGNCCFGSHGNDIIKAFHSFQFDHLYSHLISWLSTYSLTVTSPLHQYWSAAIGKRPDTVQYGNNDETNKRKQKLFEDHWKARPDVCHQVWVEHYERNKELFVDDHCTECSLSGLIDSSESTCAKYDDVLSPDAVDWRALVTDVLVDGCGIDESLFYTVNTRPGFHYFGFSIARFAQLWRQEGATIIQEQIFAETLFHSQLMHKLGDLCNWNRRGRDYLNMVVINPSESGTHNICFEEWTRDHREYSDEFLLVLINKEELIQDTIKQERLNEERRL